MGEIYGERSEMVSWTITKDALLPTLNESVYQTSAKAGLRALPTLILPSKCLRWPLIMRTRIKVSAILRMKARFSESGEILVFQIPAESTIDARDRLRTRILPNTKEGESLEASILYLLALVEAG